MIMSGLNPEEPTDGLFEVEQILAKSLIDNKDHYQVKWKGGDLTWEPMENLQSVKNMVHTFEKGL